MEKKIKAIREFRDKNEAQFLSKKGVVGVGTGFKEKGGTKTDQLSIRVYVSKKMKLERLNPTDLIPATVSGKDGVIPTDVIEIGHVMPHSYTQEVRPIPNGMSIGHYAVTAGTKGVLAVDNTNGNIVILSNNHILANSNAAKLGDPILQPGVYDGGTLAKDKIATLTRFQPIDFENPNTVDCAIATPINQSDVDDVFVSSQIQETDPVIGLLFAGSPTHTIINPIADVLTALNISLKRPIGTAELNMNVHKCGRTTEYSSASIGDIDATIQVTYEGGVATFVHQIITGVMSKGGDSGSLVLNGGPGGSIGDGAVIMMVGEQCIIDFMDNQVNPPEQGDPPALPGQSVQSIRDFRDNDLSATDEGKNLINTYYQVKDEVMSIVKSGDLEVQSVIDRNSKTIMGGVVSAINSLNSGGKGEGINNPKLKQAADEMMSVFEKKGSKKLKDAIRMVRKEKFWKETPAYLKDVLNSL